MNARHTTHCCLLACLLLSAACGCNHDTRRTDRSFSTDQSFIQRIQDAERDILADAAVKQPDGPSYEFFRDLLPPLRYVEPNFKHYPITLSAPGQTTKARFISNGSAVNALARARSWVNETGKPVTFLVGDKRDIFGSNLANLDGPRYADGYLPIVQLQYTADGATYAQEAFAATDPKLAAHGVVFVKLTLISASGRDYSPHPARDKDPAATTAPVAGVEAAENFAIQNKQYDEKVEALIEGPEVFKIQDNRIVANDDKLWAAIHPRWILNTGRGAFIAPLKAGEAAYMAVFTTPADASFDFALSPRVYDQQRARCAKTWNDFLEDGLVVETPEKVVNDAARATLIGNFMLLHGDEMRYSQGNQYAKQYVGEGGDAIRTAALWGHGDAAERMMKPLFIYTRAGLEFHQASFKLQMLAHVYRLTRDRDAIRALKPLWQKEIDVIVNGRKTENGMFPREKYCGDVDTRVFSLNSNANAWRALRDMSVVLEEIGDTEQARKLDATQREFRKIILDMLETAIDRSVDPPFVPIALSGEEQPHQPIWATTIGSYWSLMIGYVLGSGVFPADSQTATDVIKYLQTNGGMCMGMTRSRSTPGNFWVHGARINDLYGMRYALTLLQRDEVDRALVSFYGKLAQGMTRDTFIGGEGSSIPPLDEFGRQFYLPPNSAANANFLQQLRYILVQDYDLDDDGREETLRLSFATPRRWLEDRGRISVQNAPTVFGKVSYIIERAGDEVNVDLNLPQRSPPAKTLLRLRLPDGSKIASATAQDQELSVDGDTIDLTGLTGTVSLRASVTK